MQMQLYQTLENRDNNPYIESYGPFICTRNNAWLGHGYYFWDTHIELAHWWGDISYAKYSKEYVICYADAIKDELCWDLHGDGLHRIQFAEIVKEMLKSKITTEQNLLVPNVIMFFKKKGTMKYTSIRAMGINSIAKDSVYIQRMRFAIGNTAYLDRFPPIQVCLFYQKSLSLSNYTIVYPSENNELYA